MIRQSKGRDEALSPAEQRGRIVEHCRREGWELVDAHEEIDVSGGTPLVRREGLRSAVESVEGGKADVVVVAYFDRLVRSLRVQDEVVSRVEAAGGRVVALDFGQVTGKTAAQWLSGTMIGAVSEYYRRSARERSGESQALAVSKGIVPFADVTPAYERAEDRTLVPGPLAPVVRQGFEMRAGGATLAEIRAYFADNGVKRSYHGVQSLMSSRLLLGEIHFGELVNLDAHEAVVDRETWDRVQAMKGKRAARPVSGLLLARLGVLRCGSCRTPMVAGLQTQNGRRYPFYRCSSSRDCDRRMVIGARIAEGVLVEATKRAMDGMAGRASAADEGREAEAALDAAQGKLDAAIRVLGDFGDEPAALERLRELRAERDAAHERVSHLRRLHSVLVVTSADWDRLTTEEHRGLIRELITAAYVGPGKGAERVSVVALGE